MRIVSFSKNTGHGMVRVGCALLGIGLFLAMTLVQPAQSAEEAELMERWLVNDSLSNRAVDHTPWANILATYLKKGATGQVVFDYAAVSETDRDALAAYIETLSRTDVDRLNRTEQKAFWINAYNALVAGIVLSEYPVKSINDVGGWFLAPGPWQEKRFRVYQIDLSLNDIYHRILRPIWDDPRIHYALSCGAAGCPPPFAAPFQGVSIESDLDAAASAFINHGAAVLFIKGNGVTISRIYDWYEGDFGPTDGEIIDHIRLFAEATLAARLEPVVKITGHGFDWTLNDYR